MSFTTFKQLGLGVSKSMMRLLMEDRSIKKPIGILYDILVKVDVLVVPMDFIILDCEIDSEIPIILVVHSWLSREYWWMLKPVD